ncbi:MAG: hypothetical protein M3Q55_15210 [Acidobacteriota bacterium]|nr:hypothetical protein [Acidobacteriota bacterium]
MLSKKNQNRNESVDRLRDLLTQLKTARHESDDLARQARDEVVYSLRGGGLKPARPSGTTPSRKKKAATRKAGKKKR